ncbi:MAG: glycosyltransferase family 2 protein, partial [Xanthomonadaceae bacterium]|nr:glycosyltransferase family 2 protein [Xanthomonadaceae bacterium]
MHTQVLPAPAAVPDYHLQPGDAFYRVAILAGFVVVVAATWHLRAFHGLIHSSHHYGWLGYMARPSLLWAGMGLLMLLYRTLLWFRYRTPPVATMDDAPTLTVIIPAFNEGEMVARSIESVASARYPRGRLEIFVVDDGSRDDTWVHIERAAARFPGLVTTLRFPQNRGKRAALEAGFRRGKGEVMVTIDSDSVIDP